MMAVIDKGTKSATGDPAGTRILAADGSSTRARLLVRSDSSAVGSYRPGNPSPHTSACFPRFSHPSFLLPSSWPPDLLRSQWGKPRHMGGVSASRPHRKTPFWGRPRERTGSNLPPEDGGIRSGMAVPDSSKPIQSPGHGTARHAARGRGRGRCPTAVHPISRFPSPLCGMRRKAEVMTHAPKPLLPCIGPTHYTRRLRSHALHASCQGGTRGRTMSVRG